MNVILLSGGSGKRLWPLSNDVRSKQFIKLFKDGDKYESMVQRVYRQITTVDADAKITIATSKSQASAIKNQLGEKASICVEPCRRDTFPAIALAAAYLHDELNVGTDEAVVVCPVDPYVDNTYYEAVKALQELAEQGNANLTLMGIEPTYPSEKYGYIIPESGENVSKVKEFKEKPDVGTAKKYLAQSALWNAGIFAFKLGYLLDKAHSMIDFEDYRDLFNKYDTLTKISFDYAVVEKESSIQVLRYSGDWKDVGTWNMMAEVMADKTKGKAVLDEICENTNVVNELNIPILCMGCKDMIIAASGDGILISDKERSGYMKPYVEKIETEAMYAEKSWGTYTVIDVQPGSMTVKISMKAGEKMSYHMHNEREEVWTVVSGKGKAIVDGMEQVLRTGDVITIAAGCKHTVEAITPLDMIEVQLGDEKNVGKLEKMQNYIASYKKIGEILRADNFDVLHTEWYTFSPIDYLFLSRFKKKYGVKYVATVHDILPFNEKFYDRYFHKKLYELADSIILQAPGNVNRFAELFPESKEKTHMIPHGHMLDYVEQFDKKESRIKLGIPEDKLVFLFFGQIKKVKGVDVLLKALLKLKKQYPSLYVVIAGSVWKADFSECQEIINSNDLTNCLKTDIRYIPDDEVKYYYSATDVCVLPYTDVYQSGVIQLAYGYKKAVVSSDLPAFTQFVKEGKTGYISEAGNPDSLAQAMERAIKDCNRLSDMGEAGYDLVKQTLNWDDLAKKIVEECYN